MANKKKQISLDNVPMAAMPMELDILHGKDYADALDMLFHDDKFQKLVAHRQRMFQVAGRPGANVYAITKGIQKDDRTIADTILMLMMRLTLEQPSEENLTINELWKQVPADKQQQKVQCSYLLDIVTFFVDIIESKLVDIQQYLREMFPPDQDKPTYSFKQLDGVRAALHQMSVFFGQTREQGSEAEKELYCEYADSIEAYCDKRMKTYHAKMAKLQDEQRAKKWNAERKEKEAKDGSR